MVHFGLVLVGQHRCLYHSPSSCHGCHPVGCSRIIHCILFWDAIPYNVSASVEGMEYLDLTIESHSICANTSHPSCDQHVEKVANLVVLQRLGGLKNWQILSRSAHLVLFCVAIKKNGVGMSWMYYQPTVVKHEGS